MAIGSWHVGKLILFWIVCLAFGPLVGFGIGVLFSPSLLTSDAGAPGTAVGTVVTFVITSAILVAPFVVTWKWFSAREPRSKPGGSPT